MEKEETNNHIPGAENVVTTDVNVELVKYYTLIKNYIVRNYPPDRNSSIAITNLQTSMLWLGMDRNDLNK